MKRLGTSIDSGQDESLQATTEASSLIPKSKKPKIFKEITPSPALGMSPTDKTESNSSAGGEMIEKKLEVPLESVNMSVIHGQSDITVSRDNLAQVFPYKDLNKYVLEIRIVTLKAGPFNVPILCMLDHVATNKGRRPKYKALSYTWGPPDVTKTISLNGLQIQVRENLWNALRHLRNEHDDLRIWIDAISINQNNIHERNQQVSRMSAIYGMASEVVVWLGPQSDGSEIAMSYIESNFGERSLKLPLDYSFTPEFETQLEAIEHLLKREYWQRVWIIQEIFRARKINVHCGHLIFGWASFSRLFSYFDSHLRYTKEEFRFRLQQICSSSAAKLTEHRRSATRNLEELLTTYRYSLSSDPRDKIYSLIGLANRVLTKDALPNVADEWIIVDYSKSSWDLFQTLTWMHIRESTRNRTNGDWNPESPKYIVRWMRLLQAVLGLDRPNSEVELLKQQIFQPSWHPVSFFPPNTWGRTIPALGGSLPIYFGWYDEQGANISPIWGPAGEEHQQVLVWHDQLPCSTSDSRSQLEKILSRLNEKDFERMSAFTPDSSQITKKKSPFILPETKPPNVRVLMMNDGQYFLLCTCTIDVGDSIICFPDSDIALVVESRTAGAKFRQVRGRVLPFHSNHKRYIEDDLLSRYAVFPMHFESLGGVTSSRDSVKLSIQDWQALTW